MSAQIINIAAFKDQRRADEKAFATEEAKTARKFAEIGQLAEDLGGNWKAKIVAELLVEAAETLREANRSTFVPAYCDPANETRGAKYEATRNLSAAEISARIRADIKAVQKAGTISAAVKTSVRLQTYSGGWSVDVRITALPDGFKLLSERYASWVKQFGEIRQAPIAYSDTRSEEFASLMAALETIRGAYNRDNSDSSTDYFDTRYHGSVSLDWRISDTLRKAEIEAASSDYWAE